MGLDVYHIQLTLTPDDKSDFFPVDFVDSECNVPLEKYAKFITAIEQGYTTSIDVKGVYYNIVGYQNKWMNDVFYNVFPKYMFWGNREDFEFAYTCVADEWYIDEFGIDSVNEMRRYFKENFVDKYDSEKSLLWVSF